MTAESLRLRGLPAAPGLAAGRLVRIATQGAGTRTRPSSGGPDAERAALGRAIATAIAELQSLKASQPRKAAQILEFQLELLDDDALSSAAFAEVEAGAPALQAWERTLDAQIADYASAE